MRVPCSALRLSLFNVILRPWKVTIYEHHQRIAKTWYLRSNHDRDATNGGRTGLTKEKGLCVGEFPEYDSCQKKEGGLRLKVWEML
jgi:hypothetical protein